MTEQPISEDAIRRLQFHAEQADCSVDDLINRLLSSAAHPELEALRHALDNAVPAVVVDARAPGKPVVCANSAFTTLTGYPEAEVIGTNLRFLYGADDRQPALEALRDALRSGSSADITVRNYRKDGSLFWNHLRVIPHRDSSGEVLYFVGLLHDVTQQKQLESALRTSSEAYRFFTDNNTDAISIHDSDGRFIYANDVELQLTGYSREELRAFTPAELSLLIHPDDRARAWEDMRHQIQQGKPMSMVEFRLRRKDGRYVWVETSANPIRDENGDVVQSIGITRDISRRKEAEQAIRYQAMLLQQGSDAIIATDRALHITSWNDSAARIYGWTEAEALGQAIDELLQTEWISASQAEAQTTLLQTGAWQGEIRQRIRSGEFRFISASVRLVYDDSGELVGGVTVNRDITRRRIAENALRESEERYKLLTEMMSDYALSVRVDPDQSLFIEWVTGAFNEITGYDPSYVGSMATLKDTHPDDLDRVRADVQRTLQNQPTVTEYRVFNNRTRNYVWLSISRRPVWDEQEQRVVRFYSVAKDITERKRAEDALRQSEARLRSLVETQTAFVVRTDMDGNYTYCNRPFLQRYGWVKADLIGTSYLATILPADHEKTRQTAKACLSNVGEPVQVMLRKPRQDGGIDFTLWEFVALRDAEGSVSEIQCIGFDISEQVRAEEALHEERQLFIGGTTVVFKWRVASGWPVSYVSPNVCEQFGYDPRQFLEDGLLFQSLIHPDDVERVTAEIRDHVRQGRSQFEQEYRLRHGSGDYRWVYDFTTIVRDAEGTVKHFQGYVQDITERRQARDLLMEQNRLTLSLQREKELNATTQRVIATLAHDLRTPLAVIGSAKEILSRYFDQIDPEQRRERLETIGKQLQYVTELLNDLAQVTGASLNQRAPQLAPVNLVTLCQITVKDMQASVAAKHRLNFTTDGTLHTVIIDDVLVSRILINLLSNAVKYSDEGSEIRLELASREDRIVLRVIDQGIGIAPEDRARIFEPFYRVQGVGDIAGTGLGLSIVQDCVSLHGGTITVESAPGKGSIFTVELPLSRA